MRKPAKRSTEIRERLSVGAFSILELVVAAGLTALMGGLVITNLRQPAVNGKVNGLAETLASELRQARLLAINAQVPVAICFPGSAGGTAVPYATGLYQLEGWSAPVRTRASSFTGDFPGTVIVNGSWAVDASKFHYAGAGSNVANPPMPGQKWKTLNLDEWLPAASKQDYCFVFGPDGTCRTNDLAAYDNAFHLLVSGGVKQFGGGAAPTGAVLATKPAYFTPQQLGKTSTVSVEVGGAIEVSNGVPAMAAGAIQFSEGGQAVAAQSDLAAPAALPSPNVSILKVDISPKSPSLSAGTDVSVGPDGFVTLRTEIVDLAKSGVNLYCNWTVAPLGGITRGPSAYSIPVKAGRGTAFVWEPTANAGNGAWVSTWQWRPPADGQAADRYSLTLAVQDGEGQSVTAAIPPKVVSVCPPGEIFYQGGYLVALWADMWKMNVDGSGRTNFQVLPHTQSNPAPNNESVSDVSADGSRVLFQTDRTDVPGGLQSLMMTDRDGSSLYRVSEPTVPVSPLEGGSLSPFGDLMVYRRVYAGTTQLCVVNTDPNPANRRTVVVDDLGPKGGGFLQMDPVQVMMGYDKPCFDRRVELPARVNTLYYVKNTSTTDPKKLAYKIQLQLDANGAPLVAQPAPTPVAGINNFLAANASGARSLSSFVHRDVSGTMTDRIYFTADDFSGSGSKICYLDVTTGTVTQAFNGQGSEEVPVPWMDGLTLKIVTAQSIYYFPALAPAERPSIELFTPISGSSPTDRVTTAGITTLLGSRQSGMPIFVKKRAR